MSMLRRALPELQREHHVRSLSLIGSVARDEARADSDVDVLVEFDQPVGLFAFVALQNELAKVLGVKVDLVTRDAIRPEWRKRILSEAVRAA
ncbi:MAG: nucleotidyltransferase family protein [Phycisphaerales bacterium]